MKKEFLCGIVLTASGFLAGNISGMTICKFYNNKHYLSPQETCDQLEAKYIDTNKDGHISPSEKKRFYDGLTNYLDQKGISVKKEGPWVMPLDKFKEVVEEYWVRERLGLIEEDLKEKE